MRLMRIASCVLPVMAVALAMAVPVRAEELALNTSLPSRILLDLQRREISVLLDGRMRGSWPVAIGDPKTPTPQGEFSILTKKIDPIYVSEKSGQRKELSGPTSPIGDRYLAFHRNSRGEFGIHGTPWPHWVKTRAAVSLGCVRMLNVHVRQLFDLVDVGTTLEIRG
ncbi:L,D-transpeptidase [Synechococcus sp. AH-551-C10]|nr:L,D-transpeptidase [Synechococcus sp. AH-551-C10]MDB4659710.1 L,D-transpeptidase [Synechococcus sp. AH-551-C10]